jgi:hypothetical protein
MRDDSCKAMDNTDVREIERLQNENMSIAATVIISIL